MRYNSIGEYFYRLSNRCLALALLPMVFTWVAYLLNQYFFSGRPWLRPSHEGQINITLGTGLVVIFIFYAQLSLVKKKLKHLEPEPSLGIRIKQYIPIVLIRFRAFGLMLLLIGLCNIVTAELICFYLLPIPVLSFMIYWPVHWRVSRDLKLKPTEQEVLRNKTLGV